MYEKELRHEGLNKYRVIKGNNYYVVQQKAQAQLAQWDEQWQRKLEAQRKAEEREAAAAHRQQRKEYAAQLTSEAEASQHSLSQLLSHTLGVDDRIDWDSIKDKAAFPEPKPKLIPEPNRPQRPIPDNYPVRLGFLGRVFPWVGDRKRQEAGRQYQQAQKRWEEFEQSALRTQERHRVQVAEWEHRRNEYLCKQAAANDAIDAHRRDYESGVGDAVRDYCELVLVRSDYPDDYPQEFDLDYNEQTRILVVNYSLPTPEALPTTKAVKYIQSRDELVISEISDAQKRRNFDGVLYQITLRTIHELFEADAVGALDAVVFNGWVRSIDPAIGKETNNCVLSVQASKDEFESIDLANVDPKACFKHLKGVGSSKLHSLTPVAPLVRIDREDKRFVEARDVVQHLNEGVNLAAMDWEDFEHLVRELFGKMFEAGGGEVKITQASRDAGVDAVAFDPDPIRGGKIVIQAKRYTNAVGVAAVRDLYGTVVNEGATKGILVTTADYGPDSYEFAKGKPLTLLNGANLLHLLEEHGTKARIDLVEAKALHREGAK